MMFVSVLKIVHKKMFEALGDKPSHDCFK